MSRFPSGTTRTAASLAEVSSPSGRKQLSSAEQATIFSARKALALSSHQARLAALRNGESCISATVQWQALENGMQQERQANIAIHKANRAEVRSLFARNGLSFPEHHEVVGSTAGVLIRSVRASWGPED
jgi:hypothetical protein